MNIFNRKYLQETVPAKGNDAKVQKSWWSESLNFYFYGIFMNTLIGLKFINKSDFHRLILLVKQSHIETKFCIDFHINLSNEQITYGKFLIRYV